jgi:DNA-binding transcriptional ArsR family regulator
VKIFECIHALKALGEETRIRIVQMLLEQERSVNDIAETLGITQYNVSKHLRVLREAGLLEIKKDGQQRFYSLAEDFQSHLSKNDHVLDLGCCTFRFDKPVK